jgi:hypothetical protein
MIPAPCGACPRMSLVPYPLGLLFLAGVLLTVALAELVLRGRSATRWREYLVLVSLAGLGAGFGAAVDSLTVRLSPDYFALGKGLGYRPDLFTAAVLLGVRAGSAAGAVFACGFLFAATAGGAPRLGAAALLRATAHPLLLASVCGTLFGLSFRLLAGQGFSLVVAGLSESQRVDFTTVWGIHIGLYLGGVVGTMIGMRKILARRGVCLREALAGSVPFLTPNASRPPMGRD